MKVDILAIGAHPDDVDLGIGGALAQCAAAGQTVAILDLSRGEQASRGTPEIRADEAAEAARLLGVSHRENAALPDGSIANVPEQRRTVARWIRHFQPRILFTHMTPDRHPDHIAAHDLVRDANFMAGLHNLDVDGMAHRAGQLYFYHPYFEADFPPSFVLDISDVFEQKLAALAAFKTQFHNPEMEGPETMVASAAFWERIELRARFWGGKAGFRYGEPLHCLDTLGLASLPGIA